MHDVIIRVLLFHICGDGCDEDLRSHRSLDGKVQCAVQRATTPLKTSRKALKNHRVFVFRSGFCSGAETIAVDRLSACIDFCPLGCFGFNPNLP